MKNKLLSSLLFILLFLFINPISAEKKEVRFITGYINSVENNLITLTNDLLFRADEHVTAISMTPVVFVLEKDYPEGFVYIKDRKIDVTLMKRSNSSFAVPASPQDLEIFNIGNLEQLKTLSSQSGKIDLANGDTWFLSDAEDKQMLKNWKEDDWVIVYKPVNSKTNRLINTRTTDQVKISKTHEAKVAN